VVAPVDRESQGLQVEQERKKERERENGAQLPSIARHRKKRWGEMGHSCLTLRPDAGVFIHKVETIWNKYSILRRGELKGENVKKRTRYCRQQAA